MAEAVRALMIGVLCPVVPVAVSYQPPVILYPQPYPRDDGRRG